MSLIYKHTRSLCPLCGTETDAFYEEMPSGMWLRVDCPMCGRTSEHAERDIEFFKSGYEIQYKRAVPHLVLPVTYRCNLQCRFCYSVSNMDATVPADWSSSFLREIFARHASNVTMLGGEPTLRSDLFDLISFAKESRPGRRVSIGTNGMKLTPNYVRELKNSGLDFVFLSLNDLEYEESPKILEQKMVALENCAQVNMPVWLQRTVDSVDQLDSLPPIMRAYEKTIFNITIRAVKSFGVEEPEGTVFVSEILDHLGKRETAKKGINPFARSTRIEGKPAKICSWVNDVGRIDSTDSDYLISSGEVTKFHRGMRLDELRFKKVIAADTRRIQSRECATHQ